MENEVNDCNQRILKTFTIDGELVMNFEFSSALNFPFDASNLSIIQRNPIKSYTTTKPVGSTALSSNFHQLYIKIHSYRINYLQQHFS